MFEPHFVPRPRVTEERLLAGVISTLQESAAKLKAAIDQQTISLSPPDPREDHYGRPEPDPVATPVR